jgi:hypothetical protein
LAGLDYLDEKRRLMQLYAALSDEELQKLAQEAASLTQTAREVLDDELDRRDLDDIPAPEPAEPDELHLQKLVTIRKFRDLPEALLAKGSIESAGIQCFMADDNLVRLDWFISNFIGGIKLKVQPKDAEAAMQILDQPIPAEFGFEGTAAYEQPRCPKCYSLDISFEELNKPVAFATAYFGVPIPLARETWVCHTCGRRWEEVADESDDSALGR